ncbi:hypothetical protein K491DRAFT_250594 [Lophiostoma macrostomum CBS 122681]|uniref:Uncharacterized protein n=1 Tax=Lophiostoma macrostomum CBS 122681 TaxID=1314788 RepID=A0A6A6SL49_9PLEO|nr:hypothetical protein K491DRAFT_250594 [Lophiostoma macrostomum CBS 122681]
MCCCRCKCWFRCQRSKKTTVTQQNTTTSGAARPIKVPQRTPLKIPDELKTYDVSPLEPGSVIRPNTTSSRPARPAKFPQQTPLENSDGSKTYDVSPLTPGSVTPIAPGGFPGNYSAPRRRGLSRITNKDESLTMSMSG